MDEHIKALFVEKVEELYVTCEGFEHGTFNYSLSSKKQADLTSLTVTTNNGTVLDASEYIVDASKVDYTKTGDHEIIVTYKYDETVKAILKVSVPQAETYSYLLDRDETQGVIQKDGIVVVSSPEGHREVVDLGGTLTLTAVPNEEYKFDGWYITNSYSEEARFYSSNATETFTITDDTYIYAHFAEKVNVTLTVIAGEHGNVSDYNAETYSPPQKQLQFVVLEGSKVRVSAGEEAAYFKFIGWYDGEGENAKLISDKDVYEFTVTENATVYARFDYSFSVNARIENPEAGKLVGEGVSDEGYLHIADLPNNASVTVEVKPNAGYTFIGWFIPSDTETYNADSVLSTDLKYTFTVSEETRNVDMVAVFRGAVTEIKLEATTDFGLVLDGDKLVTEYVLSLNQQVFFDYEGHPLLGKVGETYQRLVKGLEYSVASDIDVSRAGTYTITYTYLANPELKATITVKVIETGYFIAWPDSYAGGRIIENGQPVNFGNGRVVEKGTQITLTAEANEGYYFVGWFNYNDDLPETLIAEEPTYTFTVSGNLRVVAKFAEKEMYHFSAYPSEAGYFTENGQQVDLADGRRVEKGTQITLTANVKEQGYRFVGWYFYDGQQVEKLISENATHTFTVNGNMDVYAKFVEKEMHIFIAYIVSTSQDGGRITENGQPVNFGNGRPVEKGTQITLTAEANEGYNFVGWYKSVGDQTEELISPDANYTFTVNEETYVYAKFVENPGA